METSSSVLNVLGVDVSKASLDACWLPDETSGSWPHDAAGIARIVSECRRRNVQLVCLEATGGLERQLVRACQAAEVPVAVVNPRQIRDFARAMNRLAKTDTIDARSIALFADRIRPEPTPPSDENAEKLRALTTRRQQVTDVLTQEKNRLRRTYDSHVQEFVRRAIDLYQEQLDQVEREIQNLIQQNAEFHAKAELIQSVPGIGATTVAVLVTELPELGRCNQREIASLVGVAPVNRDSGQFRGKRMTGGGRSSLRRALFMPTLVAVRHNPTIRKFYQRLIGQGKPKMVALIAAMRKLLICLNSMLKTKQAWKTA